MRRGGSTLLYNLVQGIFTSKGLHFYSGYADSNDDVQRHLACQKLHPKDSLIIKCHSYLRALPDLRTRHDVRFIYSYRDVRDAVVSFMRMYDLDLRKAVSNGFPKLLSEEYFAWTRQDKCLVLAYDRLTLEPYLAVSEIAIHCGIKLANEDVRLISEKYSIQNQKKYIQEFNFSSKGVPTGKDHIDPVSQLHSRHIFSGKSRQWRVLPWYAVALIEYRFRDIMTDAGMAFSVPRIIQIIAELLFRYGPVPVLGDRFKLKLSKGGE